MDNTGSAEFLVHAALQVGKQKSKNSQKNIHERFRLNYLFSIKSPLLIWAVLCLWGLVILEEAKRQLKKLEEARANLARQIETSIAALAELDDKISQLKFDIAQQENIPADQLQTTD